MFFAYIGFDAISTAAEETKDPQRNMPLGIMGGLAICTVIYMIVGAVLTGMVPYQELGRRPIRSRRAQRGRPDEHREDRLARRGDLDVGGAAGVPVRPAAHLLRDGARRPAAEVGGQDQPKSRMPHVTTIITGVFVAIWSLIGDAGETYDLTNIGTLFAFALVCIGVLVLRYTDPDRPRPFRVPFVPSSASAARCVRVRDAGPAAEAWVRFGWWLVIGLALYFVYGYKNSTLRCGTVPSSSSLVTRPCRCRISALHGPTLVSSAPRRRSRSSAASRCRSGSSFRW